MNLRLGSALRLFRASTAPSHSTPAVLHQGFT
jgi:hypothetical protein